VFDPMTDPVLILDREGRLLRANRAFYQTTGLDPQSAVGLPLAEITHPDGESESCEVCTDYLKPVSVTTNEDATSSARDQIQIWLHDIYTAQGEWLGTMQLIRDLTVISRPADAEIALL
jgi:two-component system sporulation sensor kinase A